MTDEKIEKIPEDEYIEEKDIADILEQITPFIEKLAPQIIEYQKIKAPQIKRHQNINFIIMMTILVSISLLAYYKIIDGSAATGLIGAVIGYVFGGLYISKDKPLVFIPSIEKAGSNCLLLRCDH